MLSFELTKATATLEHWNPRTEGTDDAPAAIDMSRVAVMSSVPDL